MLEPQSISVHGRTGHLEIEFTGWIQGKQVHGRTGHLETKPMLEPQSISVHGRTGHLEIGRYSVPYR